MAENKNETCLRVKDINGSDYLCPVDALRNANTVSDLDRYKCVESDVAGRYAGNIEIVSH